MSSKKSDKKSLARRTLEACRNQLFFENRFLEQALFRLQWEDDGAVSFGSEGMHLYYRSDYVLERYMQAPQQLMSDYLHTVIHCLYQHPFFVLQEQGAYWDLASDIAAECILEEIVAGKDSFLQETAEGCGIVFLSGLGRKSARCPRRRFLCFYVEICSRTGNLLHFSEWDLTSLAPCSGGMNIDYGMRGMMKMMESKKTAAGRKAEKETVSLKAASRKAMKTTGRQKVANLKTMRATKR